MQISADDDLENDDQYEELSISGLIYLAHKSDIAVEVRRGMAILTCEGWEAGQVAAIIIDRQDQQVTHILLGHLSQIPAYRRVPINLIEQVCGESVLLCILGEVVNHLPTWHGA